MLILVTLVSRVLSGKGHEQGAGKLGLGVNDKIILISDGYATGGWGDDGRVAWQLIQWIQECSHRQRRCSCAEEGRHEDDQIRSDTQGKESHHQEGGHNFHDITTAKLKQNYSKYTIIDSRAAEEYNGAQNYGETKGGHLKGAVNIPFASMFNKDGTLKQGSTDQDVREEGHQQE